MVKIMVRIRTPVDPIPSLTVAMKLGSAMVHIEEFLSPGGHEHDRAALQSILDDHEVLAWRKKMDAAGLLPVRR